MIRCLQSKAVVESRDTIDKLLCNLQGDVVMLLLFKSSGTQA